MRNILKQTSYVFLAQVLTRAIGFFYVIYLARILGVLDFGLYTVALAYFSIISSIADLGFNRFLIREVATKKSRAPELLWTVILLRLILTSVLFVVFSIFLYLLDADVLRVSLILLATLAILPQAVALTFDAIFVAIQKLQFSAVSLLISSLVTSILGFILVSKGFGPFGAVTALILGQIAYFLVLLIFLYKFKLLIFSKVNLTLIRKAIKGSLPYGLLAVLGLLYFRIDLLLLTYLKGNFEAGIYGVAYKFLEGIVFIPSAFGTALFPVMSKFQDRLREEKNVYALYLKSLVIMLILSLPVFLTFLLILPQVVNLFLPQFQSSIGVVQILALTIPWLFLIVPQTTLLLSSDKYISVVLIISVFNLLINVLGNFLLIPHFSYYGAAYMTVLSDIIGFIVFYVIIKKYYS